MSEATRSKFYRVRRIEKLRTALREHAAANIDDLPLSRVSLRVLEKEGLWVPKAQIQEEMKLTFIPHGLTTISPLT